jgi:hypothetical protein
MNGAIPLPSPLPVYLQGADREIFNYFLFNGKCNFIVDFTVFVLSVDICVERGNKKSFFRN